MDLGDHNVGGPRELGHFVDHAGFERFQKAYTRAFESLPPARVQEVDTSFGRVRAYWFSDAGAGVPIVLLPGSGAATPMWSRHLTDLTAMGHPVVAIEPIGQPGASRQRRPIRAAEDATTWFTEALETLGPDGAHVIGISLGGWLGLHTAVRSPERFRSLTVIDPPSVFTRLSAMFLVLGIGSAVSVVPVGLRRRMLDALIGLGPSAPDDPETELSLTGSDTFGLRLPVPAGLTDDELSGVKVPVLALIGGRSRVHDATRAAARARLMPDSRVEVWPEAGHVVNGSDPERFATTVRSHITDHA